MPGRDLLPCILTVLSLCYEKEANAVAVAIVDLLKCTFLSKEFPMGSWYLPSLKGSELWARSLKVVYSGATTDF